jgi:hypothetical protein
VVDRVGRGLLDVAAAADHALAGVALHVRASGAAVGDRGRVLARDDRAELCVLNGARLDLGLAHRVGPDRPGGDAVVLQVVVLHRGVDPS